MAKAKKNSTARVTRSQGPASSNAEPQLERGKKPRKGAASPKVSVLEYCKGRYGIGQLSCTVAGVMKSGKGRKKAIQPGDDTDEEAMVTDFMRGAPTLKQPKRTTCPNAVDDDGEVRMGKVTSGQWCGDVEFEEGADGCGSRQALRKGRCCCREPGQIICSRLEDFRQDQFARKLLMKYAAHTRNLILSFFGLTSMSHERTLVFMGWLRTDRRYHHGGLDIENRTVNGDAPYQSPVLCQMLVAFMYTSLSKEDAPLLAYLKEANTVPIELLALLTTTLSHVLAEHATLHVGSSKQSTLWYSSNNVGREYVSILSTLKDMAQNSPNYMRKVTKNLWKQVQIVTALAKTYNFAWYRFYEVDGLHIDKLRDVIPQELRNSLVMYEVSDTMPTNWEDYLELLLKAYKALHPEKAKSVIFGNGKKGNDSDPNAMEIDEAKKEKIRAKIHRLTLRRPTRKDIVRYALEKAIRQNQQHITPMTVGTNLEMKGRGLPLKTLRLTLH
ncbi:hypothetical protein K435DRAFT_807873 [Dendrothele bispora CBS 962.96]|uniref:DUF6532 domain-containing protein n=1 Tax=Dendrothele bispora (strain CBS 962.96) TaxID=1314807 RepID=A0A4S8L3L0_DENBC|nr:hypothetical protein K435DRAFT_807873 [Dendrothele bispora CBS 962.96]